MLRDLNRNWSDLTPTEPATPMPTTPAPCPHGLPSDGQAIPVRPEAKPDPVSGPKTDPSVRGHRDRLRQRFLDGGDAALPDYELLELILFAGSPRADVKPVAKRLIRDFGSLANVLAAAAGDLARTRGVGQAGIAAIKAAQAAGIRLARKEASNRQVLNNYQRVIDFCRAAMAREAVEEFRVLYLDKQNRLIADEIVQRGTVDHTPVYPREVAHQALDHGATAVILAHNHPSGDATPSGADIRMTKTLKDALAPLGITVLDHLVIAAEDDTSFRALGLL